MISSQHVWKRLEQLIKMGCFDCSPRQALVEIDKHRITITISDNIGLIQVRFREYNIPEPRYGTIIIDFPTFFTAFTSRFPRNVPITFDLKNNQLIITDTNAQTLIVPPAENCDFSGWEYDTLNIVKTIHYERIVQQISWLLENLPRSSKLNFYADNQQLRIYSVSQDYELGISIPGNFFNGQYMTTFNEPGIEALHRTINYGNVQSRGNIILTDRGVGFQTKTCRLIFDAEYIEKEPLNLFMEPQISAKFDLILQDLSQTKFITFSCNSQNRTAVLKNSYITLPGRHVVGDIDLEFPSVFLAMLGSGGSLIIGVVKDNQQQDVLILRKSGRYLAIPLNSQLLSNPTRNLSGNVTLNLSRPAVKRK